MSLDGILSMAPSREPSQDMSRSGSAPSIQDLELADGIPRSATEPSELATVVRKMVPSSSSAPSLISSGRRIEDGPIVIGVCAMAKKATSGPMNELLKRLESFTTGGYPEFRVVVFEQSVLLEKPVEEWPLCEALIAFFSEGFPLHKAQQYAALRRPLVFNDLVKQESRAPTAPMAPTAPTAPTAEPAEAAADVALTQALRLTPSPSPSPEPTTRTRRAHRKCCLTGGWCIKLSSTSMCRCRCTRSSTRRGRTMWWMSRKMID